MILNVFNVMSVMCQNHEPWMSERRLEMDTYNESTVSARVIVVLCIEISCNSLIALLAFKGHANVVRVALYATFILFDALPEDLCVLRKSCGKSFSISAIARRHAPIAPSLPAIFSRASDSLLSQLFKNSRSWKIVLSADISIKILRRSDGASWTVSM